MKARIGQHHAGIGQHGLGDDAGDIPVLQRCLERWQVVEFDDLGGRRQVAEFPGQPWPVGRPAGHDAHHRLVDRAMVAAVEHQDLLASGDGAGDAQREAVGVGGGRGDLPEGQAETLLEQRADGQRILARQHVGQAAPGLAPDGAGDRRWRMTEHRAGIAEAEIVQPVAVDVGDGRAPGVVDQDREGRRPVGHPVHGHAAEEAGDAVADPRRRFRPRLAECGRLRLAQFGDAGGVDAAGG